MTYLYSWLKELYPEIPALEDLEPLLIQLGHDVESITPRTYNGVIVAEIKTITKHPNADRLSLVSIFDGTEEHEVVCGAPDLEIGQKVAYAPIGTTLACGLTIKKASVRGVESHGMLCAEDELGLGVSHASLLPIPSSGDVGSLLEEVVPADAIISLDLTRNRGDLMSHFGLARELKAAHENVLLTQKFLTPEYNGETSHYITINTIHPDADGLGFGYAEFDPSSETPLYMKSRLLLLGQKTINLATDITNYLLLEYGQPLHAYDYETLGDKPDMGVRRARNGETFSGLNQKSYTLTPQCLVITANDTPVSLAGILGGEPTKVSNNTTKTLIESAHFLPKAISIAARGLGILTEGALRWERSVDPELQQPILEHTLALLQKLAHARVSKPEVKLQRTAHIPKSTKLDYERLQSFFGSPIDVSRLPEMLRGLGCTTSNESPKGVTVSPPSWRPDLGLFEDYSEEIARLIGLNNLGKKPLSPSVPQWRRSKYWKQEWLKDLLVALGGYEISTYPFMSKEELADYPNSEKAVEITQAPLENKNYMRTSLIPGVLQAIAVNPENPFLTVFEVGRIYIGKDEPVMLAISSASNNNLEVDSFWQNMFERLRLPVSSWMSRVKTIDEDKKNYYKIRKTYVTVLELPVDDILQTKHETPNVIIPNLDVIHYTAISRYQESRRDVAFVVDTVYQVNTIANSLRDLDPYIAAVELFDTYRDPKLGENKYSLAFRIYYQSPERTLTDEEIKSLHQKVEEHIKEHYHGTIR